MKRVGFEVRRLGSVGRVIQSGCAKHASSVADHGSPALRTAINLYVGTN